MTGPLLLARLDLPRPHVAEDAPALAVERDGFGLIGVFDGLGGAGARRVDGEDGQRSSAYYAARVARAAVLERFGAGGVGWRDAPALLSRAIGEALARRHAAAPPAASAVRSRLIRSYPTTAALILAKPGDGFVDALAMWAGDSRCYAVTPRAGLQQLSRDDTTTDAGSLRALREDGRMTNVLCADRPGRLSGTVRRIGGPALLIAVTDGGYACLPSPMHLELALLDALAAAACCETWTAAIAARLAPLVDDDVSLAAAFAGWPSLSAASACFAARRVRLCAMLHAPLAEAWERYRPDYMALADAA